VPLEELESQLRDDVKQRMKSGLSARRAFEEAADSASKTKGHILQFNIWLTCFMRFYSSRWLCNRCSKRFAFVAMKAWLRTPTAPSL
jgi:hypothetical protein